MGSLAVSQSVASPWAAILLLKLAIAGLQAPAPEAITNPQEATRFSVPSRSPDEDMQAGAQFARELDPSVEISYRDSQSGALSVSRVDGHSIKCILRVSPDAREALKPLGRFLNDRIDPRAQALFAMAHEIGHCKLRDAFLRRPDGRAADSSVFPWLAQEAAADVYGILSAERRLPEKVAVRQAVILARMLGSAMYHDKSHATGHYVSEALALCRQNRTDADAVQCAISTAYYTVGSLASDEKGSLVTVDSAPQLIHDLGVQKISEKMPVYDDIAQYKAQFSSVDLRRFGFDQVSRHGDRRYITAESAERTDMTYRLADFYGFKTGELVTEDQRHVTVLRIDGDEELDWLLTLGAVVHTQDGKSLRKGDNQR